MTLLLFATSLMESAQSALTLLSAGPLLGVACTSGALCAWTLSRASAPALDALPERAPPAFESAQGAAPPVDRALLGVNTAGGGE